MLPGALAPPAPAGYHNVVIVPGLTAVLPDGYVLPAYIVAAATGARLACKALTSQPPAIYLITKASVTGRG